MPALIIVAYILIRDRKNPEPVKMLLKGFGYGILAVPLDIALISLISNIFPLTFNTASAFGAIAESFINAAIPEEAIKILLLWLLLRKNSYFNEHMDGIVYAVCVGMGFAATENVLYLFSNIDNWQVVAIGRAFLAIPGHYIFAVVMGYFYALAYFLPQHRYCWAMAYLLPVLLHGMYDSFLMLTSNGLLQGGVSVLLFLICFIYSIRHTNKLIRKQLMKDC